jgi:hypothetical protein
MPTELTTSSPGGSVPAVFDAGSFELMMRATEMLAHSTWLPDALTMQKDEHGNATRLPDAAIRSNCFLVVELARRWSASPIAVAQCIALVHGKICVEGKLVHAVLEAQLGTRLAYAFDERQGEQLGVVVSGRLPGEREPRTVEGTVAAWRTSGKGSPWMVAANWKRQLRYRGAREWARAHAPAVLLGIYTADELDDGETRDITPRGAGPALPAPDIPDPPPPAAAAPPAQADPPDVPEAAEDPAPVSDKEFMAGLASLYGKCTSSAELTDAATTNAPEIEERGLEQAASALLDTHLERLARLAKRKAAAPTQPTATKADEAEYVRISTAMRAIEARPTGKVADLAEVWKVEQGTLKAFPETWQKELEADKDRIKAKLQARAAA